MPYLPKARCTYADCANPAASGSFCDGHEKQENAKRMRDPARRIYRTSEWRGIRKLVLKLQPYCTCGQPATDVDHISTVRTENEAGRDPNRHGNLQAMCHACHARKTVAQDGGFGGRKT